VKELDSLTKEDYEEISMIFFPTDKFKTSFTSSWEQTRENIARHIVSDDIPLSFSLEKYFQLYKYLEARGIKL